MASRVLQIIGMLGLASFGLSSFGLASLGMAQEAPQSAHPVDAESAVDFQREIRPILISRCLKCHGPGNPQADLDLTSRDAAVEHGAILPGDPDASPLLERIATTDDALRMPLEDEPLTATEIELVRQWIRSGAPWPQHWAYRPLAKPSIPVVTSSELRAWCRTPVDRFVAERLDREGLKPSAEADRFTLLRRASFDLRGIPPTPDEVRNFLGDDSPLAWQRCVDRLLASPHYGERWARHWMDLVHFAETHGHDQDRPREHAWRYRDYLIRSLNEDKPYARFVAEQIAGDVLDPLNPDAIEGLGFLAAGPWDESSLRDIREDSLDRQVARYLDRDDIVTTVMSTLASTSIHCARCHDHKFDPITQAEYYGLQAVFAGIDKANRAYDADSEIAARRTRLHEEREQLESRFAAGPETLLTPELLHDLKEREAEYQAQSIVWQPLRLKTIISQTGATLKQVDDGSVLAEGPRPDKDVYVLQGTCAGESVTALRLDVLVDPSLPHQGPGRQDNGNLHLNELRVLQVFPGADPSERELSLGAPQADFNQEGWGIAASVDGNPDTAWGIFPKVSQSHFAVFPLESLPVSGAEITLRIELHQSHGGGHLIGRFRISATNAAPERLPQVTEIPADIVEMLATSADVRTAAQQTRLAHWFLARRIDAELAELPPPSLVYAGTNRFAPDGSFRPAPAPRDIQVLGRGLVTLPQGTARPGTPACLEQVVGKLTISDSHDEGARRQALAAWLTDARHPLVWRSIANRVWQYHFGRGLVDTPNDFGQMGATPTHPELLDWLAVTLQEHDGSLKELHRLILNSATYRQDARIRPQAAALDAENRWLWRMQRRRLEAESFRDALLVVTGTLDSQMGGPSVRQFIQTPGPHVTPHVDYEHFDVDDPANYRRSVYRFLFRTIPDPFMEALDCPDASQLAPQRTESLTALQALATLNDKFVVRQSERMASRLQRESPDIEQQIVLAYIRILGREPQPGELQAVAEYAVHHGLANTCRFLFNTNEFLFVD